MKLLNQRRLPTMIGGLKHMMAHTAMWVSNINFALIGITAYNTSLREPILTVLPGFKLWHFLLIMLAVVVGMMILEYKLIYPSWIAFQNKQEYEHQNLLREDIAALQAKVDMLVKAQYGPSVADVEKVKNESADSPPGSPGLRRR